MDKTDENKLLVTIFDYLIDARHSFEIFYALWIDEENFEPDKKTIINSNPDFFESYQRQLLVFIVMLLCSIFEEKHGRDKLNIHQYKNGLKNDDPTKTKISDLLIKYKKTIKGLFNIRNYAGIGHMKTVEQSIKTFVSSGVKPEILDHLIKDTYEILLEAAYPPPNESGIPARPAGKTVAERLLCAFSKIKPYRDRE